MCAVVALVACSDDGDTSTDDGTTTTTTGPTSGIESVGAPTAATRVGPAADHPMALVDRDAGVSVELRDGSMLWLFGDTAEFTATGSLAYFVVGTAAWAPASSPTTTHDASIGNRPFPFATPTAAFLPCPINAPTAGMWPYSAVVQPVADRDRVIVWMENVCLGPGAATGSRGMSVAEWWYDPAAPPDERPIVATVLNQVLFPTLSFGAAAVLGADGLAYTYGCDRSGALPRCGVARVSPFEVANPRAYEVWTGGAWLRGVPQGAPLAVATDAAPVAPAGAFTVAFDENFGAFVMVETPWPGYGTTLDVRIADRPEGPWSVPASVELPDCDDHVDGVDFYCYAATAQPAFSRPGELGVGWYDRVVATEPRRGAYFVSTVPIEVSPRAPG
ncbi:MAG TPA: DUF4185 domain-containing protein [Microthrixaceae bacterium]|nr:DUF4185 domain-containing protein [Microthrixaceae bacterium]